MKPIVPAVKGFVANNGSLLLTGTIIGTNLLTAVVSGVNTHKADIEIFDTEDAQGRILEPKEKAVIYAKHHIGTGICILGHGSAAVGSYNLGKSKIAALDTALNLASSAAATYKDAVVEKLGEEKAQEIEQTIAERAVREHPIQEGGVIYTAAGETACLDILSGRMFGTNVNKLREAQNNLNDAMLSDPYDSWVTLNDYYQELGLEPLPVGWDIGWDFNIDGQLHFNIASTIDSEGRPVLTVDPDARPKPKRHS